MPVEPSRGGSFNLNVGYSRCNFSFSSKIGTVGIGQVFPMRLLSQYFSSIFPSAHDLEVMANMPTHPARCNLLAQMQVLRKAGNWLGTAVTWRIICSEDPSYVVYLHLVMARDTLYDKSLLEY